MQFWLRSFSQKKSYILVHFQDVNFAFLLSAEIYILNCPKVLTEYLPMSLHPFVDGSNIVRKTVQ